MNYNRAESDFKIFETSCVSSYIYSRAAVKKLSPNNHKISPIFPVIPQFAEVGLNFNIKTTSANLHPNPQPFLTTPLNDSPPPSLFFQIAGKSFEGQLAVTKYSSALQPAHSHRHSLPLSPNSFLNRRLDVHFITDFLSGAKGEMSDWR